MQNKFIRIAPTVIARFMDKVAIRDGIFGCWTWTAATKEDGYGRFQVQRISRLAHRVSWTMTNGPIPDGRCVLHRCDNPACVCPQHLFLGTQADNAADKVAKRRQARGDTHGARKYPESRPRGDANGRAKLAVADVIAIREAADAGEPQRSIGKRFGVSGTNVHLIVHRKKWMHVS